MNIFQKLFGKKEEKSETSIEKTHYSELKSYLDGLKSYLNQATQSYNNDISSLKAWISYLYSQKQEHRGHIDLLKNGLSNAVQAKDLHEVHKNHSLFSYRLDKIEENQAKLIAKYEEILTKLAAVEHNNARTEPVSQTYRTNLQNKVVAQVNKNSKEYIKNTILNLISKYQKIRTSAIKEIVVDEMRICSQSTLYRILNEVREEQNVKSTKVDKEFIFETI